MIWIHRSKVLLLSHSSPLIHQDDATLLQHWWAYLKERILKWNLINFNKKILSWLSLLISLAKQTHCWIGLLVQSTHRKLTTTTHLFLALSSADVFHQCLWKVSGCLKMTHVKYGFASKITKSLTIYQSCIRTCVMSCEERLPWSLNQSTNLQQRI